MLSFVLSVIALLVVFVTNHRWKHPIANLYTLHSWFGISAIALFAFQWCAGFISFLYPLVPAGLRAAYLPIHVFLGLLIFILACIAAVTGITEELLWKDKEYSTFNLLGIVGNLLGICIIIYGSLVIMIATKTTYKR